MVCMVINRFRQIAALRYKQELKDEDRQITHHMKETNEDLNPYALSRMTSAPLFLQPITLQ